MMIRLLAPIARIFKQGGFKNGILFAMCICGSACASNFANEVNLSPPLKESDKTYPLVYEIKDNNGKIDWLSGFVPGQGNVVTENDKQWQVVNLATKKVVKTISLMGMETDFIQLSQTNNRLLIAKSDSNLKIDPKVEIWDTRSWTLLKTFDGIISKGNPGGLSPDGSLLFLNGVLWSVKSGEKLMNIDHVSRWVDHSFSSDNRYFAVSSLSGGTQLIDINAIKEIRRKTEIEDAAESRFRDDNHYYASFGYDFDASYQYGGDYALAVGLFSPINNSIVSKYISPDRITCWTVTSDGNVFVARVNGDVMLLSPELVPLKKWSIKQKARYCAADNKNQVWLGVDYSGIYKIDLTRRTIEHPIKLSQNILKFILSQDGKYLGFESEIDKVFRVQVYRIN